MKIATLDIETAPILADVWGIWQQNVAISQIREAGKVIMVGSKWLGDDKVTVVDEYANGKEGMLLAAHRTMSEADVIVGHNVHRFDINYLNTEFLKMGLAPPDASKVVDTLKVVKSSFRFDSNKLDFVAQQLGLGGKLQHPGWEMWAGWMAGNAESVDQMRAYCAQDVALTEKVYLKLRPWVKSHPNAALHGDLSVKRCTNCGSEKVYKKGTTHTKVMIYQRYKCQDCGCNMRGRYTQVPKEVKENILVQEI